jgi:glutamate 5-kinase
MNPAEIKRVVVKLGTNSVICNNQFNAELADWLARDVSALARQGRRFVLVSSGAIGLGLERMHLAGNDLPVKMQQAMAAVGQSQLMHEYEKAFSKYNQVIAHVLLTQENLENRQGLENLRNTLEKLLELNIVPIINENDAVAIEELASKKHFSDNDILAARLAVHMKADLLVIVSGVGGLFSENPECNKKATLIERVKDLSELNAKVSGKSTGGRGGFETKLLAADIALKGGIPLIVTKGKAGFLGKILAGEIEGTLFEK